VAGAIWVMTTPKHESSLGPQPKPAAARPSPAGRVKDRRPDAQASKAALSSPSQLLAEVTRLRRELDAAHEKMRRLEALADEDALCGILNRRGFDRDLRHALAFAARYATPVALVLIDLDDFKKVNDTAGHRAGDELLKAVAATLARNLRASDNLARIGGDEFAVLLWHATREDARLKAGRLVASLPAPASVGVAALAGTDAAAVFEAADLDMYAGKRARKCRSAP
jgi:diguanylate cyclase (GGDEF)-like protein